MARIESLLGEKVAGNFTSMIDIVFLLLVFFLLLPFKETDFRLAAHLPKGGAPKAEAKVPVPPIQLEVAGSDGQVIYLVNGRAVARRFVAERLLRESGGDRTVPVVIEPRARVRFRHVLVALDECAVARMERVSFSHR
jgi:biopolymer transport protein ExbD